MKPALYVVRTPRMEDQGSPGSCLSHHARFTFPVQAPKKISVNIRTLLPCLFDLALFRCFADVACSDPTLPPFGSQHKENRLLLEFQRPGSQLLSARRAIRSDHDHPSDIQVDQKDPEFPSLLRFDYIASHSTRVCCATLIVNDTK